MYSSSLAGVAALFCPILWALQCPALGFKVFEPPGFSLRKERHDDFGRPVLGAQPEDILGRQTAAQNEEDTDNALSQGLS